MKKHRGTCSILLLFVSVLFVGMGVTIPLLWQASSASYQEIVQLSADMALHHLSLDGSSLHGINNNHNRMLRALLGPDGATVANDTATLTRPSLPKVNTSTTNIRRIHHLGERNSGTNFMNQFLHKAFPQYRPFASEIPVLGYKHMVSRSWCAFPRSCCLVLFLLNLTARIGLLLDSFYIMNS